MNARLIILLLLGLGVAVGLYVKKSSTPAADAVVEEEEDDEDMSPEELADIRARQTPLGKRPLAGQEPSDRPVFSMQVEVDRSSGKNRLCAYITEEHGYYVETFRISAWYKGRDDVTGKETRALVVQHFADQYLKANDTLETCFEVVPAELADIGGDIGTSEDWEGEVLSYNRARLENPNPLPSAQHTP